MDEVKKCHGMWENAETDTEKFAALFVISKIIRNTALSDDEKKKIFDVIGFNYLYKLSCADEDDSNDLESSECLYKSLTLSILSSFISIPAIANDPKMLLLVPCVISILDLNPSSNAVGDALLITASVSQNAEIRQNLLDNGVLPQLLKQYKLLAVEKEKVLVILMMFVLSEECDFNDVSMLVQYLSEQFLKEQSLQKFELSNYLISVLLKYSDTLTFESSLEIQKSLTDILQSKLSKPYRDSALKLAGIVVHKFGSKWLTEHTDGSILFFKILVQITTVEIPMILDDKSVDEIGGELFLLCSCYIILETVVEVMVTDSETRKHLKCTEQFCNSISMAFKSIIGFIKTLSDDWLNGKDVLESNNCKDVIIPTIRAICCWLSEETYAFQEEVIEVLPFVLEICRQSSTPNFRSNAMKDIKISHFCFAPLCHLTADDRARQVLLDNNLLPLLFEEFNILWMSYKERDFPEGDKSLLLSLCGVFLNIVVLESQLVSEQEDFFGFLKLLFRSLPQVPYMHCGKYLSYLLPLKANFAVLGLFIARQHFKRVKSCEGIFYNFLSSSIKFLWDAHQAQEHDTIVSLDTSQEYSLVWADIMELWFLGMQALSTLLPLMPWIGKFLVESGWPQKIIATFAEVSENKLDGNLKSTYQAFLSSLVQVSKEATSALLNCNALQVCKKHNMTDLESLLVKN